MIPLTVRTDINGLAYYAVAEEVVVGGHKVHRGNIVDRRDISPLPEPPVRILLETKKGRYVDIVSALSELSPPEGANALLFNEKDLTSLFFRKEIFGTPCKLKRLEISSVYRLCS